MSDDELNDVAAAVALATDQLKRFCDVVIECKRLGFSADEIDSMVDAAFRPLTVAMSNYQ